MAAGAGNRAKKWKYENVRKSFLVERGNYLNGEEKMLK